MNSLSFALFGIFFFFLPLIQNDSLQDIEFAVDIFIQHWENSHLFLALCSSMKFQPMIESFFPNKYCIISIPNKFCISIKLLIRFFLFCNFQEFEHDMSSLPLYLVLGYSRLTLLC